MGRCIWCLNGVKLANSFRKNILKAKNIFMKRKERILHVSLDMFNELGEANLTAVDIADEMDISPGNLYYHYRGKEEIIEALFDRFDRALQTLLHEALNSTGELEDFVALYFSLLAQTYDYRFFYRNTHDLLEKYPGISRRFKKLMQLKITFCEASLARMMKEGLLDPELVKRMGISAIAEKMVILLNYFYEYKSVTESALEKPDFIKTCFRTLANLLVPYAGRNMAAAMDFVEQVLAQFEHLGLVNTNTDTL